MKNFMLVISYDGTRYSGWQRQGNTDKSIQGKIEEVLSRMCSHRVEIHGSGRTDGGVHALGQVASFKIETEMNADEIQDYLNTYLPEDIAVISACEVDDRFHARLNAKRKTYLYRINNTNISRVFERKYVYEYEDKIDVKMMRKAAERILGEHDFIGFSSVKKMKKSTIRTIYSIDIKEGDTIDIYITGSGFLYNMVRIIVGTLLEVGSGKKKTEDVDKIFAEKNREYAGFTAPPHGLMLYEVEY